MLQRSLVIILLLFTLLLPSSCIFIVLAKKEVKGAPPVKDALPYIRCGLCEHAMFHTVRNTLDYIQESGTRNKLREERLLDHVIEPLCVPYTSGGAWLRGADWDVVEKQQTLRFRVRERGAAANSAETTTTEENDDDEEKKTDFECGPRCATAAAACDDLITGHADNADKITSLLIKSFKPLMESLEGNGEDEGEDGDNAPIRIAKQLVNRVCKSNKRWRRCTTDAGKKKKKQLSPAILKTPAVVPMSAKEVEVEEMMFRMKHGLKGKPSGKETDDDDHRKSSSSSASSPGSAAGNPGVDVYSRDEMMEMRAALQTGNREKLMELDPQSSELSDEEFATLTEMHRNEFGAKPKKQKPKRTTTKK